MNEIQLAILNPFLLAGLVFAAIGLVQEAMQADKEPKPKVITGKPGEAGKPGKPGEAGKPGEKGKDGKDALKAKASDG